MAQTGPKPGSLGALKISETHRGSHDHDKYGGFASNPELARVAGRKGGEVIKARLGIEHFQAIGKLGGSALKEQRGTEYYAEIGRKGGLAKSKNKASKAAAEG